jgi:transcriptional regulator with XRE-family HTH domain
VRGEMAAKNRYKAEDVVPIGARLRRARAERGMTISQLAERSGLTKGFLSLVERDKANTSVANLVRICDVLGVSVGTLFDSAQMNYVPKAERPRINFGGEDLEEYLLTPRSEVRVQLIESVIQPGGGSGTGDYSLRADAEVVHVISGQLDITVAGTLLRLGAGDSLTFEPSDPHSWHNPSSRRKAHVLWAIAPAPR